MKSIKREIKEIISCQNRVVKDGIVTVVTEHGTYSYPEKSESELNFQMPRHKDYSTYETTHIRRGQKALLVLMRMEPELRKKFREDGFKLWGSYGRYSMCNPEVHEIMKQLSCTEVCQHDFEEMWSRLPIKYVV
jgi:hypothetical protein